MMTALIIILSIVAYVGLGSWAFGYVRGATNDKEKGWETPMPIMSAILWPFVVAIIGLSYVIAPAQQMGFAYQQAKLKKKKKRIALQDKIRIDLQQADKEIAAAEKELEAEFRALEDEGSGKQTKRAR